MSSNLLPTLSASVYVDGRERGQLRSTIVQAAQRLNDAEWGASGNITGMRVRIPRADLWVNPCSVDYVEAAIRQMADSLRIQGQLTPLTVTPAKDLRPYTEGGIGGKFLILDGKVRWEAAPYTGIPTLEDLECVVQVYPDAYAATLAAVTMKTAQQPLTDEQAGRLLRRLRDVYEEAFARGVTKEEWPTQEEWARVFGRSQPTIARWMGIARLDVAVREGLEQGKIEEYQAAELISAPQKVQREVAAIVVASNDTGKPMSGRDVREEVNERRRGPRQTPGSVLVRPPQQLRLPFLAEKPAPDAMRDLAHDLRAWLGNTLEGMANPDKAWLKLYQALNQPTILGFINGPDGAGDDVEGEGK
jgi:ParB-like chromosome segregation protein Spo0J